MQSSKPKFRSRKLDFKRRLPIYLASDLPEMDDEATRAVPSVATGVEKEEEEEHHLKAALNSYSSSFAVVIPTPEAAAVPNYNSYYKNYKLPSSLITFSQNVEEMIGPSYCMDDKDEVWMKIHNNQQKKKDGNSSITCLEFESVMTEFERLANVCINNNNYNFPVYEDITPFFLLTNPSLALKNASKDIYEHWRGRRVGDQQSVMSGNPIIPTIKVCCCF
jgi:enhancer of polycomb-like protein